MHRHGPVSLLQKRQRNLREDVPGVRPEKSLELLKQSLFEIVEYAEAKHVRVGMEDEPGLLVERADELVGLILEIGAETSAPT